MRRVGQHAVVAPVALAWELPQRHQLDSTDAHLGQALQVPGNPGVAVEQTDMQFLNHRFVPRPALPRVLPGVTGHIHHLAWALYALGLITRSRVSHLEFAVDTVMIKVASLARGNASEPAIVIGQQRHGRLLLQFHAHAARIRRPEGEARRRGVH